MRQTRTLIAVASVAFALSACAEDPSEPGNDADEFADSIPDTVSVTSQVDVEAAFVGGDQCKMYFFGVNSPAAETFFIWNLGVSGVAEGKAYNLAARPDLYAVFAKSDASVTHHVAGQDPFDHYHVVDSSTDRSGRILWDVKLVFPGPNYDPATYVIAHSVAEMNAQVAAGVLGAPILTTDAGFAPLVLQTLILCGP